jgi:hypothetical protein
LYKLKSMSNKLKVIIGLIIVALLILDMVFIKIWYLMFIDGKYWEHKPLINTLIMGIIVPAIFIFQNLYGVKVISKIIKP